MPPHIKTGLPLIKDAESTFLSPAPMISFTLSNKLRGMEPMTLPQTPPMQVSSWKDLNPWSWNHEHGFGELIASLLIPILHYPFDTCIVSAIGAHIVIAIHVPCLYQGLWISNSDHCLIGSTSGAVNIFDSCPWPWHSTSHILLSPPSCSLSSFSSIQAPDSHPETFQKVDCYGTTEAEPAARHTLWPRTWY